MKKKIAITLIAVLLCVFSAAALTACGGIQFEGRTLDGGKVGAAYSADISVDDETVFYELDYDSELPRGLYLGEDGIIEGTPSEAGTFSFKIVAYNDSSETIADFSLTIDKGELSYTAKTLPDATAGEGYIQYLNTATGAETVTYALKEGSVLPAGLSLSAEGILSGIPEEAAENVSFTVVASAEGCDGAEASFTMKVLEGEGSGLPDDLGEIVFEDFTLEDGLVGEEYSQSIRKAYGVPGISYSIRYINGLGLPKGLSFNKDLGMITGIPETSTVGSMRFRLTASAEGYDSVTVEVQLRIYDVYVETSKFEAEYIDVSSLTGSGYSSSPQGKNMIQPQRDFGNTPVSNGYALGYLHKNVKFSFEFTSDKATTAVLSLRLGTELGDIIFDPSLMAITVNGTEIEYDRFTIDDSDNDSATKEFVTITIGTINLLEDANIITFEIFELNAENNPYDEPLPDGTMKAKGPIFDYIELTDFGDARLGWRPVVANLT